MPILESSIYTIISNTNVNIQLTSHHSAWLALMREKIWVRIKYEEEMIPSFDSMDRHWKRSCWVRCVWNQAVSNNITYPVLHGNGWKQVDSTTLAIDWDSDSNVTEIRDRVSLIQKGCGCKTVALCSSVKDAQTYLKANNPVYFPTSTRILRVRLNRNLISQITSWTTSWKKFLDTVKRLTVRSQCLQRRMKTWT